MRNKKIIPLILSVILLSSTTIGCKSSNSASSAETPYYSLNIDGEKKYIKEDSADVKDVSDFLSEYMPLSIGIDYRNDIYLGWLDLQTDEVIASDEVIGFREYYKEVTVERELVRVLDSYNVVEIEYYTAHGEQNCVVTLEYISTVKSAAPDYLESMEIEANKKYSTTSTYNLMKQADGWRLVEVLTVGDKIPVE